MENVLSTEPFIWGDTSIGCKGYIKTQGKEASSASWLISLTVPYIKVGCSVSDCVIASIWLRIGMGCN